MQRRRWLDARQVDDHAPLVRGDYHLATELREPAGRIRIGLDVAELVGAKMHDLDQPQAIGVEGPQIVDAALQCIGAFQRRQDRELAILPRDDDVSR